MLCIAVIIETISPTKSVGRAAVMKPIDPQTAESSGKISMDELVKVL